MPEAVLRNHLRELTRLHFEWNGSPGGYRYSQLWTTISVCWCVSLHIQQPFGNHTVNDESQLATASEEVRQGMARVETSAKECEQSQEPTERAAQGAPASPGQEGRPSARHKLTTLGAPTHKKNVRVRNESFGSFLRHQKHRSCL